MSEKITSELKTLVGDRLKENEPLAKHLVFRVGGPAKWFVEVESVDELKSVMKIAQDNEIKWEVIGGGSNALASDAGFDGIVIRVAMRGLKFDDTHVVAQAGVPSVMLARQSADAGLSGLEWMASLPGSVGGAVRGNAGCFGGEMHNHIIAVTVLRDGEVRRIEKKNILFGYRHSSFKDPSSKDVILEVEFELQKDDASVIKERMAFVLDKRKVCQPIASGTAGCTFKNYEIQADDLEKLKKIDVPQSMIDSGFVSAGWLIDQADLKGTKIDGARISEDHANFIINDGNATADAIIQLISLVKMKVRDQFGIQLEEEIHYIGF
ncbi:MAG: UDP-N-acetylenolpyruvoylglucosamine reductase [Candidatus Uhrbacteria bacterium GW2011_GWD2_41_121]|uniref:UDP-N-acetylenolpyruvoylglucosamine reductase n=1 Tax=Candidatus Uhrbacteria bacterium GW2011_GWC1_41_20 TaxID=1618983 RepID=A0A0G0VHZ4_9BACT|nr:MAG: UDP-N-acetylenolpyruvoylglucosamine reductase [Candidatus Uhrbacteria bacterium GW2011_GWE1_39_46]KKR63974.1 MAG: UDP-N-acetylenolpyruvoylglucosamine reductase [Candidatus Uhrbacteria bacterium GW2011_GWC2_40_450]KKR88740.1 MAG: UDP-N-acetylenolpyruvoylglucosamine reductase [Candidatus Uhrbacteria bacterium GW2011_GWE2_41_1153]KKR90233.1 MAG: UDP-N-acetylenolpyruvoylglucosamine reductase [Candidatus Uhrbacteria bacterium GW2011_GWD2_41_121]KKR95614.1 MAG: UDP-N-acetylenolpyruvoylglucosa